MDGGQNESVQSKGHSRHLRSPDLVEDETYEETYPWVKHFNTPVCSSLSPCCHKCPVQWVPWYYCS